MSTASARSALAHSIVEMAYKHVIKQMTGEMDELIKENSFLYGNTSKAIVYRERFFAVSNTHFHTELSNPVHKKIRKRFKTYLARKNELDTEIKEIHFYILRAVSFSMNIYDLKAVLPECCHYVLNSHSVCINLQYKKPDLDAVEEFVEANKHTANLLRRRMTINLFEAM